jgi:Arc/MetJ family transcription regulator
VLLNHRLSAASVDAARCDKVMRMTRTTVDIDQDAVELARAELGTTGLSATVNAALREIGARRLLTGFDVTRDIDGTPAEVQANRQERLSESGS